MFVTCAVYPLIQATHILLTFACKQTVSQTELNIVKPVFVVVCFCFFCFYLRRFRSPFGFPAASRASGQTHVGFHMAARAAQQSPAVRHGAGLHYFDDEHRPRAADSAPESSTHCGPAREGEV